MKFLKYDCVHIGKTRGVNPQASHSQSSATSSLLSAVKVLTWNLAFTLNVCMDSVVLFSEKQTLVPDNCQKISHFYTHFYTYGHRAPFGIQFVEMAFSRCRINILSFGPSNQVYMSHFMLRLLLNGPFSRQGGHCNNGSQ